MDSNDPMTAAAPEQKIREIEDAPSEKSRSGRPLLLRIELEPEASARIRLVAAQFGVTPEMALRCIAESLASEVDRAVRSIGAVAACIVTYGPKILEIRSGIV